MVHNRSPVITGLSLPPFLHLVMQLVRSTKLRHSFEIGDPWFQFQLTRIIWRSYKRKRMIPRTHPRDSDLIGSGLGIRYRAYFLWFSQIFCIGIQAENHSSSRKLSLDHYQMALSIPHVCTAHHTTTFPLPAPAFLIVSSHTFLFLCTPMRRLQLCPSLGTLG